MAIDTSDFRNGMNIYLDGEVYTILYFQHVKPGKGGAFVRTRLKKLKTGQVVERTFRAGERIEPAFVQRKPLQFLYRSGEDIVCMDMDTYDQIPYPAKLFGEDIKYLIEGMEVSAVMVDGQVVALEVPTFVELRVKDTDPGLRGDTVSGGSKPAVLESGAVIQVPLHINVGDIVKVDTRTGEYLERVKTGE